METTLNLEDIIKAAEAELDKEDLVRDGDIEVSSGEAAKATSKSGK